MITVTELAATKARDIAESEGLQGKPLRMRVIGGGCAGFSYDLFFDDAEPSEADEVFVHGDLRIVVDPLSFQYLDGTEIDYVDELHRSGFRFTNPNVKATCGCGSSFNA